MASETARPLLLPQNRRLRHLRGIYLRNLSFTRPRGRTIDDAAINKSPSKLEALRETPQLHHALSTESLRPPNSRRRSTINLSNASPITRQKKLEYTIDSKVADAFLSLHSAGEQEPIYISEVAERATNFNFQFFELSQFESRITRSPHLTVKVWVKRQQTWSLFLEEEVDLRFLNFVGTLHGTHFPPNCLVFHLIDGVYSLELPNKTPPPKQGASLPTSSYNALMRLSTLENSIQDALATQEALTAQINDIIARSTPSKLPEAEEQVQLATKYLSHQRRAVAAAQKKRAELRESLAARREAISSGRIAQDRAQSDVENALDKLRAAEEEHGRTKEAIRGQRRRICEDLTNIFNILPVPKGPPLGFQICGIALPNTTYDATLTSAGEDSLSAALGHVALLTNELQFYLGIPLPYPITPFGSRSSIRDDISVLADPQREFPLHIPRGGSSAQFRFDYGWFLLNKDIEALCNSQGLKVVDIRHTLPNLKYLLYVCSAGTDEMPERKRGGVRGLWAGRIKGRGVGMLDDAGSTDGSRRGSAESELLTRQREELKQAIKENGSGGGAGSEDSSSNVRLPFDEGGTKLTLRTKGMRENIVR